MITLIREHDDDEISCDHCGKEKKLLYVLSTDNEVASDSKLFLCSPCIRILPKTIRALIKNIPKEKKNGPT